MRRQNAEEIWREGRRYVACKAAAARLGYSYNTMRLWTKNGLVRSAWVVWGQRSLLYVRWSDALAHVRREQSRQGLRVQVYLWLKQHPEMLTATGRQIQRRVALEGIEVGHETAMQARELAGGVGRRWYRLALRWMRQDPARRICSIEEIKVGVRMTYGVKIGRHHVLVARKHYDQQAQVSVPELLAREGWIDSVQAAALLGITRANLKRYQALNIKRCVGRRNYYWRAQVETLARSRVESKNTGGLYAQGLRAVKVHPEMLRLNSRQLGETLGVSKSLAWLIKKAAQEGQKQCAGG